MSRTKQRMLAAVMFLECVVHSVGVAAPADFNFEITSGKMGQEEYLMTLGAVLFPVNTNSGEKVGWPVGRWEGMCYPPGSTTPIEWKCTLLLDTNGSAFFEKLTVSRSFDSLGQVTNRIPRSAYRLHGTWTRKENRAIAIHVTEKEDTTLPNKVPEDTARKLADPQH